MQERVYRTESTSMRVEEREYSTEDRGKIVQRVEDGG